MEESTSKSSSTKSCGFCFGRVLLAGFFAAILTNVLMALQGNNALFYFGTLVFGAEGDVKNIYIVGTLIAGALGIIFALLYALILAPLSFLNDLIKAIIFAVILTAISFYVTPKIPSIVSMISRNAPVPTAKAEPATQLATTEPNVTPSASKDSKPVADQLEKEKQLKAIIMTFANSLMFSLMLVVLYRRKCN